MAKRKNKKRVGFNLPFNDNENFELGKAFIKAPETFLESLGLTFDDITCPPEAHKAFKRGEKFRKALSRKKSKNNKEYLEIAQKLAVKYFGSDFECATIPFGVKFKERINLSDLMDGGGTATASGSVTFFDGDADTDS